MCVDRVQVVCVRGGARMQGSQKLVCAFRQCAKCYSLTRSGCGGRQRIVQSYMDHARALLKPEAAVSDWICVRHRDTLKQCVENATPQNMVRCEVELELEH
jgi:hypothetical protein